ncbi:MAG: SH3 domain-containing protein [Sulfuricurvum sp.]|nr:SH3 domain-containing protein [Sulfuricurvum sp.]
MKIALWISGVILIFSGCSSHSPEISKSINTAICPVKDQNQSESNESLLQESDTPVVEFGPKISELERFDQSMSPYIDQNARDYDNFLEEQNSFFSRYYSPWCYKAPPQSIESVLWPLRVYKKGYGSNLIPVPSSWFDQIKYQSNFESYGSISQKAVTLKWMNLRAFPTDKPLYKNPALAGEGFPFDLLQNSSVNFNEPVFLSHTSKDGAWSYIFTNNASGWVPSEGVTVIEGSISTLLQKSEKVFPIEDNVPLLDSSSRFRSYSRVGMVLPFDHEDGERYYVKTIDIGGMVSLLSIPKKSARLGISKLNKSDLTLIGTQMLNNTYGWGGMFGERDCSSMIRDMYTPFGFWLPRNSASQSKKGEIFPLSTLSNDEKLAVIKQKGIPFETIIYLKGHVLLYIGTYESNVMVMHNIWGIRTLNKSGKTGRHIVGRAIISTLELGSDLEEYDPSMKLLSRIESMNIFTKSPLFLSGGIKNANGSKKPL